MSKYTASSETKTAQPAEYASWADKVDRLELLRLVVIIDVLLSLPVLAAYIVYGGVGSSDGIPGMIFGPVFAFIGIMFTGGVVLSAIVGAIAFTIMARRYFDRHMPFTKATFLMRTRPAKPRRTDS